MAMRLSLLMHREVRNDAAATISDPRRRAASLRNVCVPTSDAYAHMSRYHTLV